MPTAWCWAEVPAIFYPWEAYHEVVVSLSVAHRKLTSDK